MKKSTDSHGDIQPDAAPQQDGDRDGEEKEGGGGKSLFHFGHFGTTCRYFGPGVHSDST